MDNTEILLKELTEASGVSGYETEVRGVIKRHLQPLGEITYDKLGSLVCRKAGSNASPKVMLAAHMDELGFVVLRITKEGFIKFGPLGGWWDHVLMAQRVRILSSKGGVTGVIGAKPPHILTDEERKKLVDKAAMYIDIGASSQEEVESAGIHLGDPIVPVSEFSILANGRSYLCKAADDRTGCAVMIAVLQRLAGESHPNTLFAVATAQEEVGLRGARTSVDVVGPDVAVVLEGSISTDVPGLIEAGLTRLKGGPIVSLCEPGMITNVKLRDFVLDIAKSHNIAVQTVGGTVGAGGTDAAAIHLYKSGVPAIVISTPNRHIHSHTAIFHRDDFDNTVKLVAEIVKGLNREVVAGMTQWE